MRIEDLLLEEVSQEARNLGAKLDSHYYAATEQDFTICNNQKVYKQDYLDNMPSDFSGLLGKFGALVDVINLIKSHKEARRNELRFEVSFNE